MRKAQNVVEVLLVCVAVVIIAIPVTFAFNHQNEILASLSKSSSAKQNVNLTTASAAKLNEKVPYAKIETAGTSALSYYNMSAKEFETALSNNITYSELTDKDSKGNNIIQYANELTSNDSLGLSQYKNISETNITTNTISDLVAILNVVTNAAFNAANDPAVQAAANGFKERFGALLDAAQS